MSQEGPVPRPASRRSQSPRRDPRASPPPSQSGSRAQDDPSRGTHDEPVGGTPATRDRETAQPLPPRSFGVHNMLNPPSLQQSSVETGSSNVVKAEGDHRPAHEAMAQLTQGPSPPRPYVYQSHQASPTAPRHESQSTFPPAASSERNSPISEHVYHGPGVPRHILTPQSPRTANPGRRGAPRPSEPMRAPFGTTSHKRVGSWQSDVQPHHGLSGHDMSHSYNRHSLGHPLPASTLAALATPPRAHAPSQHMFGHVSSSQHHMPHQQQVLPGREGQARPPVAGFPASSHFSQPVPQERPLSGFHESESRRYYDSLKGAGATAKGLPGSETQHYVTIKPPHGDPIQVPIDLHQASKQADEKRMRNAGASARFRQRKKEKEREVQEGLNKLEAQSRELERRLHDMETERDFYRAERDRFRDIVARTPGISDLASQGPPSPSSTRSGGSFAADRSPHAMPPMGIPPNLMPSYVSDPSTHERPARRRRTDPAPEFTTPSYGQPSHGGLSSLPPSGYGVMHSPGPGTPTSGRTPLPPLRIETPNASPISEHGPGLPMPNLTPGGHQSQQYPLPYPSTTRPPYETGWATRPSGPGGP